MTDTCHLPGGWSMLDAAPGYSVFAGILGGFVFAGIIALMTEHRHSEGSVDISSLELADGEYAKAGRSKESLIRARTLMLFLPAFISLLVSSFLFSEVSGEQVCARGYVEGLLSASLLGMGALGVFSGVAWMLEVYGQSQEELRRTAIIVTYVAYLIVVCLLTVSGYDVLLNAFPKKLPGWANPTLVGYSNAGTSGGRTEMVRS